MREGLILACALMTTACPARSRTQRPASPRVDRGLDDVDLVPVPARGLPPGAVRRLGPPLGPFALRDSHLTWLGSSRLLVVDKPFFWGKSRVQSGTSNHVNAYDRLKGLVRLWDLTTGRLVWFVDAKSLGVAYDPVSKRLGTQRNESAVWDVTRPRRLWRAPDRGMSNRVWHTREILISRGGGLAVVPGPKNTIQWFSLPQGKRLGSIKVNVGDQFIELIGLTPSGRFLATRAANTFPTESWDAAWRADKLWDLKTQQPVPIKLDELDEYIVGVAGDSDRWLIIDEGPSYDPATSRRFYDLVGRRHRKLWGKRKHPVWLVPHPKLGIAVHHAPGKALIVRSLATGRRLWLAPPGPGKGAKLGPLLFAKRARVVVVDSARRRIVGRFARTGRSAWSWQAKSGEQIRSVTPVAARRYLQVRTSNRQLLLDVERGRHRALPVPGGLPKLKLAHWSFSADLQLAARWSTGCPRLDIWRVADGSQTRRSQCNQAFFPEWVGFSVNGNQFTMRAKGGKRWLRWSPMSASKTVSTQGPPWFSTPADRWWDEREAWSPRRRYFADFDPQKDRVSIRDLSSGRTVALLQVPTQLDIGDGIKVRLNTTHTALTSDARWLAVTTRWFDNGDSGPGPLLVFHRGSKRHRELWKGTFVSAPAFDPAGRRVAVAAGKRYGDAFEVRSFDVASGRVLARQILRGKPRALSLDAQGRILVVVEHPTLRYALWQANPPRRLLTLPSGVGVLPVAFTPGRRYLATTHAGGTVFLWKVPAK